MGLWKRNRVRKSKRVKKKKKKHKKENNGGVTAQKTLIKASGSSQTSIWFEKQDMMAFHSLMRERRAWSLRESQCLALCLCDTEDCHTHALFLAPLFSLFLFLFYIFIHIHIRWDEDKQETSHRTEIGLCDRLSRSQWGTSYSFTMGSDTDDQFNELVTLSCSLQPYSRMNQVRETDLCYK